jgi:hypothetical protein
VDEDGRVYKGKSMHRIKRCIRRKKKKTRCVCVSVKTEDWTRQDSTKHNRTGQDRTERAVAGQGGSSRRDSVV